MNRKSIREFSFLALAALVCGPGPLRSAPVIIDEFSDDLAPTTVNTFVNGAMLGGELDIRLSYLDAATFQIADGDGALSGVTETGGPNNVQFIYDGNDGSLDDGFGLPNVDFTDGGLNDRFAVELTSVTGTINVRVRISEGPGGYSELEINGVTSAGILEFPFNEFVDAGSGADIATTRQLAIYFFVDTGEGFKINSFIATGPPDVSLPGLKILGKSRLKTPRARHAIKGTASDNDAVDRVEVKGRGSRYEAAKLNPPGRWIFRTPRLKSGNNVFKIRSVDTSGNKSPILRVRARGR